MCTNEGRSKQVVDLRHPGLHLLEDRRVATAADSKNLDCHIGVLACTASIALPVVALGEACVQAVAFLIEQPLAQTFDTLDEQLDLSGVLVRPRRTLVAVRKFHQRLAESRLQLRATFVRSSNLNLGS
ncbi:hypothetical protein AAVH_16251 [Aphelenchoides avenae]|nr:hypothetical protein AAVH_16251 [Aphelenchus avenae]